MPTLTKPRFRRLVSNGSFALAALLAASLGSPALADGAVGDFNFNETTGLINIPVARVVPAGAVQLSVGTYILPGKPVPFGIDVDEQLFENDGSIKAVGGLPGRVELSVMALHGGLFAHNRYVFGAKWLAVEDAPDHPAFAVGVQSLNSGPQPSNPHPARFDDPSVFGVVSHSFPLNDSGLALDLHAGMGTGRLNRGFAGGEFHFTPNISVLGETDGTVESAGLRFKISRRFDVLGTAQFQQRVRFGFQLNYLFGPTEQPDETEESLDSQSSPLTPELPPSETESPQSASEARVAQESEPATPPRLEERPSVPAPPAQSGALPMVRRERGPLQLPMVAPSRQ